MKNPKYHWLDPVPVSNTESPIVDNVRGLNRQAASAVRVSQTEIDFGSTPVVEKDFIITDSTITSSSKIVAQLAYVAPTGKSLDELEFDSFDFRCVAGTGKFTLHVRALEGYVADKFKINYIY